MRPEDDSEEGRLVERVSILAQALGFNWEGPGGAFLLDAAENATPCWRVHSEWVGRGITADVRVSDGAVLKISDVGVEAVPPLRQKTDSVRPSTGEVVSFVRSKAVNSLRWPWPASGGTAEWDEVEQEWRVRAGTVVATVVPSKKGALRLVTISRAWN